MLFRKRLFYTLALLVFAYVVGTLLLAPDVVDTARQDPTNQTEVAQAGVTIGAGIGVTLVLCIGGFFFLMFALLGWRNAAGLKAEKRHKELLDAQNTTIRKGNDHE